MPREIRDKIYTFALVDQGHFDPNDNWCVNETARASNPENGDPEEVIVAAHTPRTVGGILISEVQSKNAQHGWKRTSYPKPPKRLEEFTIDDITYVYETDSEDEKLPTTYHLASEVSLQLFYTCRQVYEEASVIFYGQNRFYIKEIHSLVPFLEDRPPSSRCLIRILSIRLLWDYIWANKTVPLTNTWADETVPLTSPERGAFPEACTYISGHAEFSNLKQLDLRTYAGGLHPKFLDNIKPDDILVKQLASIASPDIMTVSLMNWHPLVYTGKLLPIRKDVEKVIFAKLPNHLYGQIQRCREGITESEGDKVSNPRSILPFPEYPNALTHSRLSEQGITDPHFTWVIRDTLLAAH